jgi:hypothetical protein
MDFITFLNTAQNKAWWEEKKNICFSGTTYPITWFTQLFAILNAKNFLPASYQRIHLDALEKKILYATFNQSILGSFSFFWLGDVTEEKETKATQELAQFLFSYKGPHHIAFFMSSDSKSLPKKTETIALPQEVTYEIFIKLIDFFGITLDKKKQTFMSSFFSHASGLSLDACCMFMQYLELINTKQLDEHMPYFSHIAGAAPTLSTLSESFFSKNAQRFFSTWITIQKEYPDVFWVIFWSEQIWKAYHVIAYLKEKNFVNAKRMSIRLPYSFINRDWQKANADELVSAYQFLYDIDYAIKTGSTFCALDLFYMNYFSGKFAGKIT